MPVATMTSKGQVTVPAAVREKLRLVPGSKLEFVEQPDGAFALRARNGDIRRLKGAIKYSGPPVSIEDMNEAVAAVAAERARR